MSKAIYTYGVRIITWQMDNESDPAKKEALFEKLMTLHDNQAKYFGDDPKAPAGLYFRYESLLLYSISTERQTNSVQLVETVRNRT